MNVETKFDLKLRKERRKERCCIPQMSWPTLELLQAEPDMAQVWLEAFGLWF